MSKEKDKEIISDEKEISEDELIKEDKEELDEIVQEEDYYENMALNRFLSTPWKQVSLDERNIIPISNLENDLPKREVLKDDLEQENIEYTLFKGVEEGKYQSVSIQGEITNQHITQSEKKFDELKRMYEDPRRLSSDLKPSSSNEPKYVKPEDTKRTDYLVKKKFGEL
jgi:hypothetical protein